MRTIGLRIPAAAFAVFLCALAPATAQPTNKTVAIELEAEKDYFAPGMVQVIAVTKGGQVGVGELDVTIRRRREFALPADTSEVQFRLGTITAKTTLPAGGTIVVRPLSSAGSASGIAWMLGLRGGIAVEKIAIELKRP